MQCVEQFFGVADVYGEFIVKCYQCKDAFIRIGNVVKHIDTEQCAFCSKEGMLQ